MIPSEKRDKSNVEALQPDRSLLRMRPAHAVVIQCMPLSDNYLRIYTSGGSDTLGCPTPMKLYNVAGLAERLNVTPTVVSRMKRAGFPQPFGK